MTDLPLKIAVAVSGTGRTFRNLFQSQSTRHYRIVAVISSKANCPAIDFARENALPIFVHRFPAELEADTAQSLEAWLQELGVQWILLAGFLRPFPALRSFQQRTINIHPALLPSYGGKGMFGMNVHRSVHAAGDRQSGATVHFVTEHYDEGHIIAQYKVNLEDCFQPEDIAKKVFVAECDLYPDVIDRIALGTLPLADGIIYLKNKD